MRIKKNINLRIVDLILNSLNITRLKVDCEENYKFDLRV